MTSYVLIIDDSELIVQMLEMVCAQAGYTTRSCISFAELESTCAGTKPSAILSDLNMPDMPYESNPVKSLAENGFAEIPVVLISGISQAEIDDVARTQGAAGAISKDAGMMGMASLLPELLKSL